MYIECTLNVSIRNLDCILYETRALLQSWLAVSQCLQEGSRDFLSWEGKPFSTVQGAALQLLRSLPCWLILRGTQLPGCYNEQSLNSQLKDYINTIALRACIVSDNNSRHFKIVTQLRQQIYRPTFNSYQLHRYREYMQMCRQINIVIQ